MSGEPRVLTCRHCAHPLSVVFADLGSTPIANDYLDAVAVCGGEPYYPLRAYVCEECRLVQLEDFKRSTELFREDYAYFSSVSRTWVDHARHYADAVTKKFTLTSQSFVVEVASNDGYLLQFFKGKGIPVLGIEPSRSVAQYAIRERAIPTVIEFFDRNLGAQLKESGKAADLIIANNVLAHVPNINDFVQGFRELLKPEGVSTFEVPHLFNLIQLNQFDTIYHEHFSYISLLAARRIFSRNDMRVFHVEQIATHGGSLRMFVCHRDSSWKETQQVAALLEVEKNAGLDDNQVYLTFSERIRETKRSLLSLLIELKRAGKTLVGYGAPAKGNTLLNYCGVGADFLEFTVDLSEHKQGMFLPGSRLPIRHPDAIDQLKPDYILILPWNIKEEIMSQMAHVRTWGAKFIVPIPTGQVLD